MKPRITLITLGVDDLDRSVAFYRDGLGLPTEGIVGAEHEHGAVAFFDLHAGLRLALWPRTELRTATRRDRYAPSFLRSASLTCCGFALPLEAFITWPTRKPSTCCLPARNCSAWAGLAETT